MCKADDRICIFRRTEAYIERHKNQGYPEPSDYAIRFCEAVVAGFAGYKSRSLWTDALCEDVRDSIYLDILRDIEVYRKKHEYEDVPFILAVRECQFIIAKHLMLFSWSEVLRRERMMASEIIFRLLWISGSVNDNIIMSCREKDISYRYNQCMELEVNVNGTWGKTDFIYNNGYADIYFILPIDSKRGANL